MRSDDRRRAPRPERQHSPVGGGVAGSLGGTVTWPCCTTAASGSGRGRQGVGRLLPHRLGGEVDERTGPQQAGHRPAGDARVAIVRVVAQSPVDAGVEGGFDQVHVMGTTSPSSRNQPSKVRDWRRGRGGVARSRRSPGGDRSTDGRSGPLRRSLEVGSSPSPAAAEPGQPYVTTRCVGRSRRRRTVRRPPPSRRAARSAPGARPIASGRR